MKYGVRIEIFFSLVKFFVFEEQRQRRPDRSAESEKESHSIIP